MCSLCFLSTFAQHTLKEIIEGVSLGTELCIKR
jgi:hypothetical protein